VDLSKKKGIKQPVGPEFFDKFVLCVAYSIWRWRDRTGRIDVRYEEDYRRADHHFAWLLVSREYEVPSYLKECSGSSTKN